MAYIGFIGLGVMGGPIAGHLAKAGHRLKVYNRTMAKTEKWLENHTGEIARTPSQVASGVEFVIACVGNDDDLRQVTMAHNGAFDAMSPGAIFIDHTTVSAKISRQLSVEAESRRCAFIDAPVSGGETGAQQGGLSIMCGGDEEALAAATPIMETYAKRVVHIGGVGAGQTAKMCNQIAIAGIIGGLSEALRFAQDSHLAIDRVFDAISGGAAQSWQMDNRWATMNRDEFDFGFAIDWMRKDLALALEEARVNGVSLPVTALVDQFYAQVQNKGGAKQDTSALIRHLGDKE